MFTATSATADLNCTFHNNKFYLYFNRDFVSSCHNDSFDWLNKIFELFFGFFQNIKRIIALKISIFWKLDMYSELPNFNSECLVCVKYLSWERINKLFWQAANQIFHSINHFLWKCEIKASEIISFEVNTTNSFTQIWM